MFFVCFFPVNGTMIIKNLKEGPKFFVNVTLNEFCERDPNYTAQVSFGFTSNSICEVVYNESMKIKPGDTVMFILDTAKIPEGKEYCANVIVNSTAGIVTGKCSKEFLVHYCTT